MIGDVRPDFILSRAPSRGYDLQLKIINQNRFAMKVDKLELVSPDGLQLGFFRDVRLVWYEPSQRSFDLSLLIMGCRPTAAKAEEHVIGFVLCGNQHEYRSGQEIPRIAVRVDYKIIAEKHRRFSAIVEMEDAPIGSTYTESTGEPDEFPTQIYDS
jgi:hypothetical protein